MIIIITHPEYTPGEADTIDHMFRLGLPRLHIRKPRSTAADLEQLIRHISPQYHPRLVLHDHHHLALRYHLGGIHLNSRHPQPPPDFHGTISSSCHTIDELQTNPHHCTYRTLSPIFDSISKSGYHAAFTPADLHTAHRHHLIDRTIYALGGITLDRIPQVIDYGFGGALLLGEPWQIATTPHLPAYISRLLTLSATFPRQ